MANAITTARIVCSIAMLFFPALSTQFYVLYLTAGFTDMIDGSIARRTNTVSELGSKLDSLADFLFVAASLFKLVSVIELPVWILAWTTLIAIIKIVSIFTMYKKSGEMLAAHTILNKVTGALLFLLPLSITLVDIAYSASLVCIVATVAAIHERFYIMDFARSIK